MKRETTVNKQDGQSVWFFYNRKRGVNAEFTWNHKYENWITKVGLEM